MAAADKALHWPERISNVLDMTEKGRLRIKFDVEAPRPMENRTYHRPSELVHDYGGPVRRIVADLFCGYGARGSWRASEIGFFGFNWRGGFEHVHRG